MKQILFTLLFAFSVTASAGSVTSLTMLSAKTTTSTSEHFTFWAGNKTFQAKGATSAGSGAATIKIEGSNTNSNVDTDWVLLCTISLTLTTTSSGDGCSTDADWKYERARITAISGTDATVSVYMSTQANSIR